MLFTYYYLCLSSSLSLYLSDVSLYNFSPSLPLSLSLSNISLHYIRLSLPFFPLSCFSCFPIISLYLSLAYITSLFLLCFYHISLSSFSYATLLHLSVSLCLISVISFSLFISLISLYYISPSLPVVSHSSLFIFLSLSLSLSV
jgi:hypothetical protein